MADYTIYDNEVTIRYKQAFNMPKPVPIDYIFDRGDGRPVTIFNFLIEKIRAGGFSLFDTYNEITRYSEEISFEDVIMAYYFIMRANRAEEAFVAINEFIEQLGNARDEGDRTARRGAYTDVDSLDGSFNNWKINFNEKLDEDRTEYNNIMTVQTRLSRIVPQIAGEPVIKETRYLFRPTWRSQQQKDLITSDDGIDIFNAAIPSFDVPIIQYNDGKRRYYRIYEGSEDLGDAVDFDLEEMISQSIKPRTLSLTVWKGWGEGANRQTKKKSYVKCTYVLDPEEGGPGQFTIQWCPYTIHNEGDGVQILIDRIHNALPSILLGPREEIRVQGYFTIPRFEVNPASLHFMILNDPLFSTYLYVEESGKSRAEKKRLDIHYRSFIGRAGDDTEKDFVNNPASVSFSFDKKSEEVDEDEDEDEDDEGDEEVETMMVNVSKADSVVKLKAFMQVFTRLMTAYRFGYEVDDNVIHYEREEVEATMRQYIPGSCPLHRDDQEPGDDNIDPNQLPKRAVLMLKAPEIFTTGYPRRCLCVDQPIIIKDDEREAWEEPMNTTRGVVQRKAWLFPPPNPNGDDGIVRHFYICPNDKSPHMSLKENKTLSNRDKVPYIPCCAITDKLASKNSHYNLYYGGMVNDGKHERPGYKLSTHKIIKPGKTGDIPLGISDLLSTHIEKIEDRPIFSRLGVPQTSSSFLHCVLLAVQDPDYMRTIPERREDYVNQRRVYIAKNTAPALYRQELYDAADREIIDRIANPAIFFDPHTMYRGVEELFNVNIFVFNINGPLHPHPGLAPDENSKGPQLELPRFKLMNLRVPRPDRRSIVILKHLGSESDKPEFPQCELVVSKLPINANPDLIFGAETTTTLYDTLERTAFVYIWSFPKRWMGAMETQRYSDLITRANPYSKPNWFEIFSGGRGGNGPQIMSQRIDGHGKVRALNIRLSDRTDMTVAVPPGQPMNIPASDEVYISEQETVKALFGPPKSYHRQGMWYSMLGIDYAIFVPTRLDDGLDYDGPPPSIRLLENNRRTPLNTITTNPVRHLKYVRRWAGVLVKLVEWAWRWSRPGEPVFGAYSTEDWFKRYAISDERISTVPMAPARISRKLPTFRDSPDPSRDAILRAHEWWPTYFHNDGRVHLYPSLYTKMMHHIARVHKQTDGLRLPPISYISGLFERDSDFIPQPRSVVLVDTHLDEWIRSIKLKVGVKTTILTKLDILMALSEEPFLYKDSDSGKIYMIQNVRGREKSRALHLALYWHHRGNNVGYNIEPLPATIPMESVAHATYGISLTNTMTFIAGHDFTRGQPEFLQILAYALDTTEADGTVTPGHFAAVLPLL